MRRQEAREYNKMVYGTDFDPGARDVLTTGNQFASVKNQLSIGANAFVAVFAMFGVGFYLARQYTPDRTTVRLVGPPAPLLPFPRFRRASQHPNLLSLILGSN
jgi:hypothetical protein